MINKNEFSKHDFSSGLVVFLVALPLCLGIAMASGVPLFSGIIAGIVGGIIVGFLSNSHVSVTGPAAGLTAIVLTSVSTLGKFEFFLAAVIVAGLIQIVLGLIKAGTISNYFPNNVIEGMLAGIGVIIFLKQIPHAVGYDKDSEGDLDFVEKSGSNTITSFLDSFSNLHMGAIIVSVVSLCILLLWEKNPAFKKFKTVPGALVAVVSGILLNEIFKQTSETLTIQNSHLVNLPILQNIMDFPTLFTFPDVSGFLSPAVWTVGATIAIVASIETLLCIEAGDRMDLHKRYTNPNKELKAQGIGNLLSGLIGGLPMTSVVVRTTANINAGARTKFSTIFHGLLLMVCVLAIPGILNKIPLASLAAILLLIGYKLAGIEKVKRFWSQGKYQFIPFISTIVAVVFTDLLKGVATGMIISFIFILRGNLKRAYYYRKESYKSGEIIHLDLAQEVSFLNKAAIKLTLSHLPDNSTVVINASDSEYIAHDVLDLIKEFKEIGGPERNISVELVGFKSEYKLENTLDENRNTWVERIKSPFNKLNKEQK